MLRLLLWVGDLEGFRRAVWIGLGVLVGRMEIGERLVVWLSLLGGRRGGFEGRCSCRTCRLLDTCSFAGLLKTCLRSSFEMMVLVMDNRSVIVPEST